MSLTRIPAQESPIDKATGLFDWRWLTWFRGLLDTLNTTATQVPDGKVQLTGQTAAIGTTAIPTADLVAGLYRVSWYAQVNTAAGVSSSFQVTVSWTSNAGAKSFVGVLKNGNTTATYEASPPLFIHIDAVTPVSYAVDYASNPAAAMVYEFNLVLELVSPDN